jgi:DNA helicase-2/ATP-dependent DNA helicase PcrA
MYVGITRAKEKVYLLFTMERNIFGSTQINAPSRFLDDIPEHLIENNEKGIEKNTTSQDTQYQIPASPAGGLNTRFKDGDKVRHEIFGDGMIVATQGDIITVAFGKVGLKKLSASIAPLKKI